MTRPELLPARLEQTVAHRGGEGVGCEQRGEDCGEDELEGLEEGGEKFLGRGSGFCKGEFEEGGMVEGVEGCEEGEEDC